VAACVLATLLPVAGAPVRPEDFRTRAVFELTVARSRVLRPGGSRISAESAVATRVHGLVPGNADGLQILFVPRPMTAAGLADVLDHGARELRTGDHAALVFYLDPTGRVWQVNLSYVTRGATVARTVAWRPEDLRAFADYRLDGARLHLRSQGLHRDEEADEALTLAWRVDLDLPVLGP
jgi:hypothetical protein